MFDRSFDKRDLQSYNNSNSKSARDSAMRYAVILCSNTRIYQFLSEKGLAVDPTHFITKYSNSQDFSNNISILLDKLKKVESEQM